MENCLNLIEALHKSTGNVSPPMPVSKPTTAFNLSESKILEYRKNGFVKVSNIISQEECAYFCRAAVGFMEKSLKENTAFKVNKVFTQLVNVWQEEDTLKELTFHSNICSVATRLARAPLRLWHDQLLVKHPKNEAPTEFHQDQPYWPHLNSTNPISAWIALVDVPPEKGCMTFIPGSFKRANLAQQKLNDARSLFSICPDLEWEERVTVPLRAGDCTFHHGRCAHMASPNCTNDLRIAHVVIFMDEATKYSGKQHPVTDSLGLHKNDPLNGILFPRVSNNKEAQCRDYPAFHQSQE